MPDKSTRNGRPYSLYLSFEEIDALKERAKTEGVSANAFAREAIRSAVAGRE